MKTKVLFAFLLLLFPLTHAQIVMNPSDFNIGLIGGETVSKSFTIEWTRDIPVVCYLSYEITQENGTYEGNEMWMNFSENPVILEPHNQKTIEFSIHSLPNIQPGIYHITIESEVKLEKIKETRTITREVTVISENTTKINELNKTIKNLNSSLSYYRNLYDHYKDMYGYYKSIYENLTDELNISQQKIENMEEIITNQTEYINQLKDIKTIATISILLSIVLLLFILFLLLKFMPYM